MGRTIANVEVFQAGKHRGRTWTRADLEKMVSNFALTKGYFVPPVVIGHEEYQPLTQEFAAFSDKLTDEDFPAEKFSTGSPALGRITNPRIEPRNIAGIDVDTLVVDCEDVPDVIAEVIHNGAYNRVSAEIYPVAPEGFDKVEGPILRRVALLGGQLPHIKTISDLRDVISGKRTDFSKQRQLMALSESKSVVDDSGRVLAVFSEVTPSGPKAADTGAPAVMNDEEMRAVLAACGYDMALIPMGLPSSVLAEMVRFARMVVEEKAMAAAKTDAQHTADANDSNVEGEFNKGPVQDAEPSADASVKVEDATTPAESAVVDEQRKEQEQVVALSELQPLIDKAVAAKLASFSETTQTASREARRASCQMFCDDLSRRGHLPPALIAGGLVDFMVELDGRQVHKFADGDKTLLDKFKALLAGIPTVFTEKLRSKPNEADTEEAAVLAFCESNPDLLAVTGRNNEFYLSTFREARKTNPDLTADAFLKGHQAA